MIWVKFSLQDFSTSDFDENLFWYVSEDSKENKNSKKKIFRRKIGNFFVHIIFLGFVSLECFETYVKKMSIKIGAHFFFIEHFSFFFYRAACNNKWRSILVEKVYVYNVNIIRSIRFIISMLKGSAITHREINFRFLLNRTQW